ncbi:hypothetical protein C5167_011155 [Papaver somniferum]|uniref:Uncharacterized protein n=1 Tax=Papaver somniferum TaxID=3469 RepID=A0A4Y7K5I4_PAPSO|nr:hypothetical protein C5167_011155 [Papaver somniferum]
MIPVVDLPLEGLRGAVGTCKNQMQNHMISLERAGSFKRVHAVIPDNYSPILQVGGDADQIANVTDDSGTGVVHCPPAFYRVCIENQILQKGRNLTVAVDGDGCFTEMVVAHFGGDMSRMRYRHYQ